MADQTTNALLGISKTLMDVVAPAISADDPLAQQELRMAVRYLDFLRQRVDHLYARARFDLQFQADLATIVDGCLPSSSSKNELQDLVKQATTLLGTAGAAIEDLHQCAALLAIALSDAVRDTPEDGGRRDVERAVVEANEKMTAFERSWYFPLGLDHFESEVALLEIFLPSPSTARGRDDYRG